MAAHAGPVGAFVNVQNGTWPSNVTTQNQAWALWNSATGTTAQACKIFYYNLSQFPTGLDFQTTAALNLGIKPVICVKPDYTSNATMAADLTSFTTMANMFASHNLFGIFVLWQEPQNNGKTPPDPTAAQFRALFQFDPDGTGIGAYHAAAKAAGWQLAYDAAAHTPSAWSTYFPGAAYLDVVAVDYYCDTYTGGIRIDGAGSIMAIADTAGLPFGIFEIGITPGSSTQPSIAQMTAYLGYLTQIMGWNAATASEAAGRLFRGLTNAPVMWYNGTAPGELGLNQIVPQATAPANAPLVAYCINTGYPNLWSALQSQTPPPTLTVTTTSLPSATQSTAYTTTLTASGGTTPYTWSLQSGSLPTGLSLHAGTGVIDGTPTGTGTSSFTVKVTDAASNTATAPLSITVNAVTTTLTIVTTTLPNAYRSVAYSAPLAATGGTTPYTWSRFSGTLPAGLTLHSTTGVISGTPTTTGTSSFTVEVTDAMSNTDTQPLSISVTTVLPVFTPAVPGQGVPGAFTPGLQGNPQPLQLLFSDAVPGNAQPATFTPGDPGSVSLPPSTASLSPAVPAEAQPGAFTPGFPGTAVPPPAGVPFIAQQSSAESTFNYGWAATEFSGNSAGNMLVVLAGWDLNASGTTAPMPAAYVCDSALNYWYHAGTSSADNTGARCAIWVAPNAQPVEWVSCSLTTFASSVAYTILEIGNAPEFFTIDISATDSDTGDTVLDASPGLCGSADIGLAVMARGTTLGTLELPPVGWTALGVAQAGAGAPNGVSLYPFWQPGIPAGTDVTVAYTTSNSAPLAAVTVLIEAAPYAPVQYNPNLPAVKVEAAFGFTPGDPSQAPPQWTDITNRCAAKDGTPFIQPAMGKTYELAVPETGELVISCDNHDGAFTPGNISSEFAPGTGVMLGTPVRVSAYWAGSWFNIAFGYVERWPQEWPDMPQWGMSAMVATDAFSALSAAVSYSALNGDMLLDAPYALIPCNEQYTTQANSLDVLVTPSECQGLLAANISRTNQRPGTYVDGVGAGGVANPCATGQSTTLLGSQDTGFGCSSFTAPLTATSSGPGMIYWDPNLPGPISTTGLTVEFWLTITAPAGAANEQPTVFTAFGPGSNYQTAVPSLQIQAQNFTGNNLLQIQFANGTTMSVPFSPSPNPQQVALVFPGLVAGTTSTTISVYVNGALAGSQALSTAQFGAWSAVMLGCGNYAYANGTLAGGVFTAMGLGIYPYQLPVQRIVSHYVTGVSGQQGVDATTRIAQVLAWTGLGIPRGGQVTFGGVPAPVQQGPAYSLSGANVSDALNQVAANEQGLLFTSPDGTLQFMHRWALFNQAPALVFGDNESAGEIPFLPGQAFDYDNTYLYNIDQVTQTQGPTTGIKVTGTDTTSEAEYFNRSILQIGIQTTSNLDAYDIANQAISVYSQPSLRLRGLTVDAAANPLVAFPGVLGLQQGNAAVVNRRPVGGVPISANVIVQKVSHNIGPGMWQTSYEMSPYPPLNTVLQLDAPNFDVIGLNSLP